MKALNIFEKQIDRLPDKTDAALQNALCTFGKVATEAISVIKRKKGSYINVQATARSRRAIPLRGSRAAYFGAPRKGITRECSFMSLKKTMMFPPVQK